MKRTRLKYLLAACAIIFSFAHALEAFAVDNGAAGVQISPTTDRVSLDPGASYTNNFTIANTGNNTINYYIEITPYQVTGLDYAPIYSVSNAYTQITNWITVDKTDGAVDPNHIDIVSYTINVPEDAPGGSQHAVIFVKTSDTNTENQNVKVVAGAGVVVAAKISGETRQTGEISGTNIPAFVLNPPLTVSAKFKNTGNVDADAVMTVKIENQLNGALIYDNTGDPLSKSILPETEREVSLVIDEIPRLGVLKVNLTNEFMNDAETKSAIVFVCPLWFIAIILLIILTIVARIFLKRRDDRRMRSNSRNTSGSADRFNL
ncbi:hypothetical protein IKE71_00980 [Candidatus Saccharibacteria bacterium]|nr:hypothetical protein [Candidatus Saccharibacteria bacterium]